MTYRSFVPKTAVSAREPATAATTATQPAKNEQVSQLSQPSQASHVQKHEARTPPVATVASPDFQNEIEERSALIQFGAGVARDWADRFARLDLAAPPNGFSPKHWRLIIDDGGRFLDRWAGEAAALGWQAADVFGVHPGAPSMRFDEMGLVPLINGGEVVSITDRGASVKTTGGSLLTYTRRMSGSACLWDLDPEKAG
jgi:hypothetical protein